MRLSLATNFSVSILGVVALAIASSLVTLFAAWRIRVRLDEASEENSVSVRAEEFEIAIYEGDNLIACGLLDGVDRDKGKPAWEESYRGLKPRFQDWIAAVRASPPLADEEDDETIILSQLGKTWAELDRRREDVIALQKQGDTGRAKAVFTTDVGRLSAEAGRLCRRLIAIRERASGASIEKARQRIGKTTWAVGLSSGLTLVLGGILLWLFFYRVLFPLRGMVADTQHTTGSIADSGHPQDELRMVGDHLRNLMSDVSDTRTRLERSRNQLLVAEKLASVGRLAASVAHEIRNPLTAMKMWLFSIQEATPATFRTPEICADMRRKLAIISEEIARLETILRNFLEFSRPVTLHCEPRDVSVVIDHTLELLIPRFQSEKVHIICTPPVGLPPVMADGDQLKQVLLNLLGNAADAMPGGGEIRIQSSAETDADGRPMVVVRIRDSGPGMPPDLKRRIFEPFFTTKEKGTGLGLCIAAQIMARHGGSLVLEASSERGATFAIWLPLAPEAPALKQQAKSL
jgi:signal transduction histidine kinase